LEQLNRFIRLARVFLEGRGLPFLGAGWVTAYRFFITIFFLPIPPSIAGSTSCCVVVFVQQFCPDTLQTGTIVFFSTAQGAA